MPVPAAGVSTTLLDTAQAQLHGLARACAFQPPDIDRAAGVMELLGASWGSRAPDDIPRWSGVTDDCSPLEFSVGLTPHSAPELRFVIEAQRDPATLGAYWAAAQELNARLEREFGACLERLRIVEDLVRPAADVYFAMLHGVVLRPGKGPMFKVYLNPKAHGREHAAAVTAEAFARLGLQAAWERIAAVVRPQDELQFIALDLTPEQTARVKLYVRHRQAGVADFERAASVAANRIGTDIRAFIDALFPAAERSASRPATTMYAVTTANASIDAAFSLATAPVIGTDAEAFERVSALLRRFWLPAAAYERCVRALAKRPLSEEHGIHNYVSFQNRDGERRVTVYLQPRLFLDRYGPIGFDPLVAWPTPCGTREAVS